MASLCVRERERQREREGVQWEEKEMGFGFGLGYGVYEDFVVVVVGFGSVWSEKMAKVYGLFLMDIFFFHCGYKSHWS